MGGSFGKKKSKIIIVGLDNSGKSTMINMLKPKKVSKKFMDMINTFPNQIKMESK
jgi:GTPase SAR1 family protein